MADLLPSLASDDERPLPDDDDDDSEDEQDDNEVDKSFQFGGILVRHRGSQRECADVDVETHGCRGFSQRLFCDISTG